MAAPKAEEKSEVTREFKRDDEYDVEDEVQPKKVPLLNQIKGFFGAPKR